MAIDKCVLYGSCKCQTAGCVVLPDEGCPVYRYFKDLIVKDYENRLRADMVAMLTDIQLDIEGQKFDVHIDKDVWNDAIRVCSELIQQRINELKQESTTKNDLGVQ